MYYLTEKLKKNMYRQVFTPTAANHNIPLRIPKDWYGQAVEIIAFPTNYGATILPVKDKNVERKGITKYYGAWKSEKSAEKIIADIYDSRTSNVTRKLEKL